MIGREEVWKSEIRVWAANLLRNLAMIILVMDIETRDLRNFYLGLCTIILRMGFN
jgi:hypothetical protein